MVSGRTNWCATQWSHLYFVSFNFTCPNLVHFVYFIWYIFLFFTIVENALLFRENLLPYALQCACFIIDKLWVLGKRFSNPIYPPSFPPNLSHTLSFLLAYRVAFTFSAKGSNCTVTRLTPFRLTLFSCLPMADTMPPDRRNVPLNGIDISIQNS